VNTGDRAEQGNGLFIGGQQSRPLLHQWLPAPSAQTPGGNESEASAPSDPRSSGSPQLNNGVQCNVADGKCVLEPILLAGFAVYQLKAVTGVLPKDADFLAGDKASADQPQPEQVSDPFRILHVILVDLDCLHPFRVGNSDVDAILQKIKNRDPVFPARFHADIETIVVK